MQNDNARTRQDADLVSDAIAAPAYPCPTDDCDLYAEDALLNPYPNYARLRDKGGVVFLERYGIYALPRHQAVRAALQDWSIFSSASGVMLNATMNNFMKGTILCSDPPAHDVMRKVIMRPLEPKALRLLQGEISDEAEALVERLCAQGSFNAATELAEHLPLKIVATKVGLPPLGRDSMLRWAPAAFDCMGPPQKQRTRDAFPVLEEIGSYIHVSSAREKISESSWLGMLYSAADEGLIDHKQCPEMSFDYIGPSLDTTISATGAAIYLFAKHPEQWQIIRENPQLIPNAINEVVRLETPIQGWTRHVTRDHELDGVTIPAGARVLVMFASANRDERRWDRPEQFDVTRKVNDHVGFGAGEHACAGANLARLEISSLLNALVKRVRKFELLEDAEHSVNNITRLWKKVQVRVHH